MTYSPALIASLFMTSSFFSVITHASDISFTPRTSIAITSYQFDQTSRPGALPASINGGEFPEVSFDVTFKMLGLGGTFFKDGFYLDLSAQVSTEEEDSFTFEDPALPNGVFEEKFKGDRQDLSITFGKKILQNRGGIYIGYKSGKSEASGNQGQTLSFKENGLFVGTNYGWAIANGKLSVNVAFASLDGDLTEDVTAAAFAAVPDLDINATSDAQGLSYGVSWSSRFTRNLGYSISIDSKKYTFDNVKDSNPNAIPSDEFTEELTSAMLSIYFQY